MSEEDDWMNQDSGVSAGGWNITNAGLMLLEQLSFNTYEMKRSENNGKSKRNS